MELDRGGRNVAIVIKLANMLEEASGHSFGCEPGEWSWFIGLARALLDQGITINKGNET